MGEKNADADMKITNRRGGFTFLPSDFRVIRETQTFLENWAGWLRLIFIIVLLINAAHFWVEISKWKRE